MVRQWSDLSVSNSWSGGDRELHKVPAVGNPTHAVQIGGSDRVSAGERQRRASVQGGMAACSVVVGLELAKLPLRSRPFQNSTWSRNSRRIVPIRGSTNGCDSGTYGTVLISSISRILRFTIHPVGFEQRVVIRTETSRYALPVNHGVKHPAHGGSRDGAALNADADETTRTLVQDHEHPVASQHDGLA